MIGLAAITAFANLKEYYQNHPAILQARVIWRTARNRSCFISPNPCWVSTQYLRPAVGASLMIVRQSVWPMIPSSLSYVLSIKNLKHICFPWKDARIRENPSLGRSDKGQRYPYYWLVILSKLRTHSGRLVVSRNPPIPSIHRAIYKSRLVNQPNNLKSN
jgi:hypothetical protein